MDGTHLCFSLLFRAGVGRFGPVGLVESSFDPSILLSDSGVDVEACGKGSSTYSRSVSDSASSNLESLVGSNGAYIITPPSSSSTALADGVSEAILLDFKLARIFHMLRVCCGVSFPFCVLPFWLLFFLSLVDWPFMISSEPSIRIRSLSISGGTGDPCFPSFCIGGGAGLLDEVGEAVTAEGKVGRESMSAPIRLAKVMGGSVGSSPRGSGDVLYFSSSNSQEGGGKTTGGGLGPVYESTIDSPNDLR